MIEVEHSARPPSPADPTVIAPNGTCRTVQVVVQPSVIARAIVMIYELSHRVPQRSPSDKDHPIQAFNGEHRRVEQLVVKPLELSTS